MSTTAGVTSTLRLSDERELGYTTYGSGKNTILYFHGYPGSRLEAAIAAPYLENHDVRITSLDRPGMGLSTFQPGRRFLDWPKDVEALLDHLRLEKVHVLGVSGGAPYALACARFIPHRLRAVAIVSGACPFSIGATGMSMKQWLMFKAVSTGWLTAPVSYLADRTFGSAARDTEHPERLEALFEKGMSASAEQDVRCLDDQVLRKHVLQATREAFKQGSYGVAWEASLYGGDWGFKLEDIDFQPIKMWHGRLDRQAPFEMAEKASRLIRGAEFKIFEDDAHLSAAVNHMSEILDALLRPSVAV